MEVDSVAHESRVVDKVKTCPVLWHLALGEQLLVHQLSHFGVPQTVHHDNQVVVELLKSLATDVKGLRRKAAEAE